MRFDELMYISSEMLCDLTSDNVDVIISSHEPGYICISWLVENVYRICYRLKCRCTQNFVFLGSMDSFIAFTNTDLGNATEIWIEVLPDELLFRGEFFAHFVSGDFLTDKELRKISEIVHPTQFRETFNSEIAGEKWYQIFATAEIADINTWHPSTIKPNLSFHFFNKWVTAIAMAPNTLVTRMLLTEVEGWDDCNFTIDCLPVLKMDEISQTVDNQVNIGIKADPNYVLLEILKPNGTLITVTTPVVPGLISYQQFHSTVDSRQISVSTDKLIQCVEQLIPPNRMKYDILRDNAQLELVNSDNRLYLCGTNGEIGRFLCENNAPNSKICLEGNHLITVLANIREDYIHLTMPQKPGDPLLLGDNRGVQYTIFGYANLELDIDSDIVLDQNYDTNLIMSERMLLGVSCPHLRHLYTETKLRAEDGARTLILMLTTLTSYHFLCEVIYEMGASCNEKVNDIFEEEIAQFWDDLYNQYIKDPYSFPDLAGSLAEIHAEHCSGIDIDEFCFNTFRKISILLSRLEYITDGTRPSFALELTGSSVN